MQLHLGLLLRMCDAVSLFLLYIFMAWKERTSPFYVFHVGFSLQYFLLKCSPIYYVSQLFRVVS